MYMNGIRFFKNLFKYLEINLLLFIFFLNMGYNCFNIIGEVILYDII